MRKVWALYYDPISESHRKGKQDKTAQKYKLEINDIMFYAKVSYIFHQKTSIANKPKGKCPGYKINIQKAVAFLYTNDKLTKKCMR